MTRILLTGATGNVGAATLAHLLQTPNVASRLVAAVRPGAAASLPEGVATVPLDFTDPATYQPALQGIERLLLVRPPELSDVRRYLRPFIERAQLSGVRHVVFLSLQGAQYNWFAPHHKVEADLRRSGMGWTMLRPSFFMQNLSTTHRFDIRDNHQILLPAGQGRTAFIDVRDIGTVAARVLLQPGELPNAAYELTGAEALTYGEVAATLTQVLGRPIRYRAAGIGEFRQHMLAHGFAPAFINVMIGIYSVARLGLAARVTNTTAELLGRAPITFRQFAHDYRSSWQ
ncbi:SDR family oxidoreductase [Hymenobacter latericus]|uniref:SDR family oxidoreductase n=1 Tax=Hymenobacter sp. YIM 151858-1 TaxID=2987688 RepID=UPI00222782E9|nr:SDR family oxidoreductase [Hymenobacter sp. YIM 151858-1]UYZ60878.1 SDR family oxidoreductase [Hymenobacter sp. YIM 151858-1]